MGSGITLATIDKYTTADEMRDQLRLFAEHTGTGFVCVFYENGLPVLADYHNRTMCPAIDDAFTHMHQLTIAQNDEEEQRRSQNRVKNYRAYGERWAQRRQREIESAAADADARRVELAEKQKVRSSLGIPTTSTSSASGTQTGQQQMISQQQQPTPSTVPGWLAEGITRCTTREQAAQLFDIWEQQQRSQQQSSIGSASPPSIQPGVGQPGMQPGFNQLQPMQGSSQSSSHQPYAGNQPAGGRRPGRQQHNQPINQPINQPNEPAAAIDQSGAS